MSDANGEIEALVDEIDNPIKQQHRYTDEWMSLGEIGDDWLQHRAAERERCRDRELTGRQPCLPFHILLGGIEVAQHAPGILEEPDAWLGEGGPSASFC